MSKPSTNRKAQYVAFDGYQLRVIKNYQGSEILVFKHAVNAELSELLGETNYEVKGERVDDFPANGRYRWSVKDVVEFITEHRQNY